MYFKDVLLDQQDLEIDTISTEYFWPDFVLSPTMISPTYSGQHVRLLTDRQICWICKDLEGNIMENL